MRAKPRHNVAHNVRAGNGAVDIRDHKLGASGIEEELAHHLLLPLERGAYREADVVLAHVQLELGQLLLGWNQALFQDWLVYQKRLLLFYWAAPCFCWRIYLRQPSVLHAELLVDALA